MHHKHWNGLVGLTDIPLIHTKLKTGEKSPHQSKWLKKYSRVRSAAATTGGATEASTAHSQRRC